MVHDVLRGGERGRDVASAGGHCRWSLLRRIDAACLAGCGGTTRARFGSDGAPEGSGAARGATAGAGRRAAEPRGHPGGGREGLPVSTEIGLKVTGGKVTDGRAHRRRAASGHGRAARRRLGLGAGDAAEVRHARTPPRVTADRAGRDHRDQDDHLHHDGPSRQARSAPGSTSSTTRRTAWRCRWWSSSSRASRRRTGPPCRSGCS